MKTKFIKMMIFCIIGITTTVLLSSNITKTSSDRYGGGRDLVEELYKEEVEKNTALQNVESAIKKFYAKKEDVLKEYEKYNYYITSYYNDAKNKLNTIKDAEANKKATDAINNSINTYNSKIANLKNEIAAIEQNEKLMEDQHNLLKIMITLPIVEKYSNDALPKMAPIQNLNNELKAILENIKQLIK